MRLGEASTHRAQQIQPCLLRDMIETQANPSNATLDMLPGPSAQHVRILLTHPHSSSGKVGEEYVYGIREVYALASRMDTAVADCKEAANSDDARDKYFLLPIHEFDSEIAAKMESLEEDVLSRSRALSKKTKNLISSMTRANTCVAEKQGFSKQLVSLGETCSSLKGELLTLTQGKSMGDVPQLGYLHGMRQIHELPVLFPALLTNLAQATPRAHRRRIALRRKTVILKVHRGSTGERHYTTK